MSCDAPKQTPCAHQNLFEQLFQSFPFPMQLLSLEGVCLWINRAMQETFSIDPASHVGVYHAFSDSFVLENHWDESLRQAIRGEAGYIADVQLDNRTYEKVIGESLPDTVVMTHDISCFPVFGEDSKPVCVAVAFLIRKRYQGREEVVRAKQYMDAHWREPFRIEALAAQVNLSPSHFHRIFREQEGITPHAYHARIQVERIREQLMNPDLTIAEAFSACGIDYHGHYARLFRMETGMTPREYREQLLRDREQRDGRIMFENHTIPSIRHAPQLIE